MKTQRTRQCLTTGLLMMGLLLVNGITGFAKTCHAERTSAATPVMVHKVTPQFNDSRSHYDGLLSSCADVLTQLREDWFFSSEEWAAGRRQDAINGYYNAFSNLYFGQGQYDVAISPITMLTIENVQNIAAKLQEVMSSQTSMKFGLAIDLQYVVLNSLFNLVTWSYHNLDTTFYPAILDGYVGPHSQGDFDEEGFLSHRMPQNYFRNIKLLAKQFLVTQMRISEALVKNEIELAMSVEFANAAASILSNNLYRRSFCQPMLNLVHLKTLVNRYQCSANPITANQQVDTVRRRLRFIVQTIKNVTISFDRCRF